MASQKENMDMGDLADSLPKLGTTQSKQGLVENTGADRKQATRQHEEYYNMGASIQIDYDNVFQGSEGEKDGIEMPVTHIKLIYKWAKLIVYLFFSGLIGPIMGLVFGVAFGLMEFSRVWVVTPSVRLLHVATHLSGMAYRPVTRMLLDPIFEAFGRMFGVLNPAGGLSTEQKYAVDSAGGAGASQIQRADSVA